jgi:hypothetical protein
MIGLTERAVVSAGSGAKVLAPSFRGRLQVPMIQDWIRDMT